MAQINEIQRTNPGRNRKNSTTKKKTRRNDQQYIDQYIRKAVKAREKMWSWHGLTTLTTESLIMYNIRTKIRKYKKINLESHKNNKVE